MRNTLFSIGLVLLVSLSATAQESTPKAELSLGYSYAGESSHGFDGSLAVNVNRWLGVVADIGGQYTRLEDEVSRESIRTHSFLFGPRFSVRRKRVTAFAHALFGTSHINSDATELGQVFLFSDNSFALALGGGLDVNLNDRFAIRAIQVDYLRSRFFDETQNKGRVTVGVVFRLGKK